MTSSIQPFTDLSRISEDSYSFKYDLPNYGVQDVSISTYQIGDLILTSGRLLPWDLLMIPDYRYCLKEVLNPGRYPVVLSVANFLPADHTRIACAMLLINGQSPVKWEAALINEPKPDGGARYSYGVDSGTGSFMDVDVARVLSSLFLEKSVDGNRFEEFCDPLLAQMDENSFGAHKTAGWANVKVNDDTGANVITFSSGWGDGGYASFWGYDKAGNVASLVTDFALF